MDEKVSKTSFKAYRDWQRYIRKAHPKLSKGLVKSKLLLYCLAMASDGANGIGCYTSDATIAEDCELYDARSVRPYRHEALRLGWLVWTGEMHGRAQVLNIAVPEVGESAAQPKRDNMSRLAAPAKHDTSTAPYYCPACEPLISKARRGELTTAEVLSIHAGD